MIFDTHAHYNDEAFDNDRESLLNDLPKKDVVYVVNASSDIDSSLESIRLSEKYDYIYSCVGIHPENIKNSLEKDYISELEKLIENNKKIVAIGEIGLDYHFDSNCKEQQKEVFENQVKLAIKHDLPVIVHDREAHKDTLNILTKYKPKGIVHCFSGSVEMAKEVIKLGMFLGIGGVLTFKNAKNLVNVVQKISIEKLVMETDAPYLAPTPFRGTRCDSSYIKYTAEKLAEIKGISVDEVYKKTYENAKIIFKI